MRSRPHARLFDSFNIDQEVLRLKTAVAPSEVFPEVCVRPFAGFDTQVLTHISRLPASPSKRLAGAVKFMERNKRVKHNFRGSAMSVSHYFLRLFRPCLESTFPTLFVFIRHLRRYQQDPQSS